MDELTEIRSALLFFYGRDTVVNYWAELIRAGVAPGVSNTQIAEHIRFLGSDPRTHVTEKGLRWWLKVMPQFLNPKAKPLEAKPEETAPATAAEALERLAQTAPCGMCDSTGWRRVVVGERRYEEWDKERGVHIPRVLELTGMRHCSCALGQRLAGKKPKGEALPLRPSMPDGTGFTNSTAAGAPRRIQVQPETEYHRSGGKTKPQPGESRRPA